MATLTETNIDSLLIIKIDGNLTFDGVAAVHRRFEHLTLDGCVLVDLSQVKAMSTPGVSMLLSAYKRLQHHGGSLLLAGPTADVRGVLRRCRLDRIFTILASPEEALATFRQRRPA